MHDKFGKDGLAIYSVVLDDPKEADVRKQGLAYLAKVKVPFPVVNLDMPVEEWQKKLRIVSYPGVYVFNKDNKYVLKMPEMNAKGEWSEVDHEALDKTVESLLKK